MFPWLLRTSIAVALVIGAAYFANTQRSGAQPPGTSSFSICTVTGTPPASGSCTPVSAAAPLPVDATVNASVTGFEPASTGTAIVAATVAATGTLPAGAVVVASNTSTTIPAYCKLGATATVADQLIAPSSWFAFTVGGATQLTCITATSTASINTVGGTGLPTGAGGGGGGGSGSNTAASATGAAVPADAGYTGVNIGGNLVGMTGVTAGADTVSNTTTQANVRSFLQMFNGTTWDRLIGDTTSGVWVNVKTATGLAQGSTTSGQTGSLVMGAVTTNAPSYTTAQTSPLSVDTGGRMRVQLNADPCLTTVATSAPISITSATTTRIVAPSASNRTYVCYLYLQTGAANNIAVVEGTGGTCGTGTAGVVGGTTAANGLNNAANSGQQIQNGGATAVATAGTNVDLCLITSSIGPLAGHIRYVQAP